MRDDLQSDVGETEPFLERDKVKSKVKIREKCSEQFSKKRRGKNAMAILTSFYYSSIQLKHC